MKRGPRNMQMSREAMPPIRISPSIWLAAPGPARGPTEREPLTSTRSPGRGQLLEQRAGLLRAWPRGGSRRRSPRRSASASLPTGTSTSIPSAAACSPIARW